MPTLSPETTPEANSPLDLAHGWRIVAWQEARDMRWVYVPGLNSTNTAKASTITGRAADGGYVLYAHFPSAPQPKVFRGGRMR